MTARIALEVAAELTVDVAASEAPTAYEVVNLCGRVIVRTTDASDISRAGAIRYAAARAGAGVVAVTATGGRLADESLYDAVHSARRAL